MPAVSVVIPTYNRGRGVERAVTSVLDQSFADLELLVVDDGSDDGTAQRLVGRDQRLRCHRQPNRGPAAARNAGIRIAQAPIVAFLDADNRWLPDHLGVVHAVLGLHPEAVLAGTCAGFRIEGREEPADATLVDGLPEALVSNRVGYVSGVAVRREALLEVNGFDEEMEVGEDDDLWLRLAMRGPFAFVRRRTIVRRHTHGGLRDRGRQNGAYTAANERSVRRVLDELDDEELRARARGRLHILAAVAAVERRDGPRAREELAHACALLPEIEADAGLVLGQLWKSARDRGELRRRVEGAAAAMPGPGSHATLFLRGYAAVLALTRGRVVKAGRLMLRRPHLLRRRFVSSAARPALRLSRRRLAEILQGRRESWLTR
jgi:glycosyltransferase involved in cell wall biosynthesis